MCVCMCFILIQNSYVKKVKYYLFITTLNNSFCPKSVLKEKCDSFCHDYTTRNSKVLKGASWNQL